MLEMMSFMVGERVSDEYVPMMLEELALDGTDRRSIHWEARAATRGRAANHRVVIIGAGMSGILAAIRLEEAGIPYTVIEKNDAVGGTWFENRYPGCRVDVASQFYSYSFAMRPDWSEYFPRREEIHDYFESCVDRFGVRPHIRFRTEVTRAAWDESASNWVLTLRDADGRTSTLLADAIISAVGQLNRPRHPDIPGLDRFKGTVAHTGAWPQGPRVARQANRRHRHRRERLPARARDRAGGVTRDGVPALAGVDVPERALPRGGERRAPVGAASRTVLRALAALPAVLPGL